MISQTILRDSLERAEYLLSEATKAMEKIAFDKNFNTDERLAVFHPLSNARQIVSGLRQVTAKKGE